MDSQTNQPPEIPDTEIIDKIEENIITTGIIRAALELEAWEKVAAGADTAEMLSTRHGWDLTGAQRLLDALCSMKLMEKDGEHYLLAPEAEYYLRPSRPTYKGTLLLKDFDWESSGGLAGSIRTGLRPVRIDATRADMSAYWISDYSRSWAYPETMLEYARELFQSLDITAREGLRILDIACGPAPRSLALAKGNSGVSVALVDREAILQAAFQAATRLGVQGQLALLPGDLWEVDYGTNQFDLAYLGNITHFYGPEENSRLFQKVYRALSPGGLIVVNSFARRESEQLAWAGVWLYAATVSGAMYDFAEYKAMLESAGFGNFEDINQGPIKAVKLL